MLELEAACCVFGDMEDLEEGELLGSLFPPMDQGPLSMQPLSEDDGEEAAQPLPAAPVLRPSPPPCELEAMEDFALPPPVVGLDFLTGCSEDALEHDEGLPGSLPKEADLEDAEEGIFPFEGAQREQHEDVASSEEGNVVFLLEGLPLDSDPESEVAREEQVTMIAKGGGRPRRCSSASTAASWSLLDFEMSTGKCIYGADGVCGKHAWCSRSSSPSSSQGYFPIGQFGVAGKEGLCTRAYSPLQLPKSCAGLLPIGSACSTRAPTPLAPWSP